MNGPPAVGLSPGALTLTPSRTRRLSPPPENPFGSGELIPSEWGWTCREGFPEVGDVADWGWKVERFGLFKYEEHITAKEARVAVWSVAFDLANENIII